MKAVFVGNLDFGATESSLRAIFESYGKVERVNLVTDRDTGRARGFAYVEMTDSAEADRAIAALNGTNFSGQRRKVLAVDLAGRRGNGANRAGNYLRSGRRPSGGRRSSIE
jgi:hypothetical protein